MGCPGFCLFLLIAVVGSGPALRPWWSQDSRRLGSGQTWGGCDLLAEGKGLREGLGIAGLVWVAPGLELGAVGTAGVRVSEGGHQPAVPLAVGARGRQALMLR